MDLFNFWKKTEVKKVVRPEPSAHYIGNTLFAVSYNGEKNHGEIGPIKDYRLDYEALRLRSWQSYLDSEVSQTVVKKFTTWVIGSGLKLQAEPVKKVLQYEKITFDSEEFNEIAEARFSVFAKSKRADYAGMRNLHMIAKRAFLNAIVGGDVLVILRYSNNSVNIQLVDGSHIVSPIIGSELYNNAIRRGNEIRNGIEISPSGEHIAFYIKSGLFDVARVEARGKTGLTMAFLVYGLEYRLDNHRGIPLISAVLEKLKKMERYSEATLGSAEERQKISYAVEHELGSTGESHLTKSLQRAMNVDAVVDDMPVNSEGDKVANTIAVSTNKQVFNMPINSKLKSLESKNELYFKDFYTVNIDLVCAALGIPPEVAMSKYDSNFSASRAALKEWEHTINVNRSEFSFQFYQPIYNLWLETEILKNKIQAPGYLTARSEDNSMVIDAYTNARFVGSSVPHIDPLKEVSAERAKLGESGKNIPLTTVEAATEALNGGDSDSNMEQFAAELQEAKRLKIITEPIKEPLNP